MAGVQRIAIVDPSNSSRESLRASLLGVETVWLEAEASRYEFFADVVEQSAPDVAIVALDEDTDQAISLIQSLSTSHPHVKVIAVSSQTSGQFILGVLRCGADEFLAAPVQLEEMLGALDRLRAETPDDARDPSRIYTFAGSRGGAGCTSLAVNFGCILAQNQANSVALVDLDLAMGDADVCLDLIPDYTLADVAMSIERIDLQLLKRSLSKHSSGLYLLPHPVQIEDASLIQDDHVGRVLNLLKMTFTHIIVDLSKSFLATDFMSMQLSDEILMVTQLDVSSLRNVVRLMVSLSDRDGLDQRVKVVANRVGSNDGEISPQRAEETIGRPIMCRIPNDSRTMMSSRNSGVPLMEHAPRSRLYQSIVAMTDAIVGGNGVQQGESPKKKRGFFFGGD